MIFQVGPRASSPSGSAHKRIDKKVMNAGHQRNKELRRANKTSKYSENKTQKHIEKGATIKLICSYCAYILRHMTEHRPHPNLGHRGIKCRSQTFTRKKNR